MQLISNSNNTSNYLLIKMNRLVIILKIIYYREINETIYHFSSISLKCSNALCNINALLFIIPYNEEEE